MRLILTYAYTRLVLIVALLLIAFSNQAHAQAVPSAYVDPTAIGGTRKVDPYHLMPSGTACSNAAFTPVTLTGSGFAGPFAPTPGCPFHPYLYGSGSASCQMLRSFDSGTTWLAITVSAGGSITVMYLWTYVGSAGYLSESFTEPHPNVLFKITCGSVSGSVTAGFN